MTAKLHHYWYSRWSPRRRPYAEIDPMIRNLVTTMNSTGVIETIASCQGHALTGEEPYVSFRASIETTSSLEQVLRSGINIQKCALNQFWFIEGVFNERFELVFILRSPYYERMASSVLGGIFVFWLMRKRLAEDFSALENLFRQVLEEWSETKFMVVSDADLKQDVVTQLRLI